MYWRGRGLAWADTNLVVLYRHKYDSTQYRGRYLNIKNNIFQTVLDITVTWDHLDINGAYAMEYKSATKGFRVLATDRLNQHILFEVDPHFENPSGIRVLDGKPVGIAMNNSSELYLSYPERKIERLHE